jgi:hypothetical protein
MHSKRLEGVWFELLESLEDNESGDNVADALFACANATFAGSEAKVAIRVVELLCSGHPVFHVDDEEYFFFLGTEDEIEARLRATYKQAIDEQ